MIVRRNSSDPEACNNCGEKIGNLETPHIWNQHVVCAQCYVKLAAPVPASIPIPNPAAPRPEVSHGEILCPNPHCGYVGPPKNKSRGIIGTTASFSAALIAVGLLIIVNAGNGEQEIAGEFTFGAGIALFVIGLLVGIIAGNKRTCPRCGVSVGT